MSTASTLIAGHEVAVVSLVRVRLLVVDDKDVFRSQLRSVLQSEGFEVAEARSGEAALECVSRFRPDVVVMDTMLPGMSGIEATRSLLRLVPQTAVIMLSMFDGDELVEMAAAAGVSAYLAKDARLDEILSAIQAAAPEALGAGGQGASGARTRVGSDPDGAQRKDRRSRVGESNGPASR